MKTLVNPATREVTRIKRQISRTLRSRLKEKGITVASIARDAGTSRTAIRRVLDDENTSITLHTLVRTAQSLGYTLHLTMEPTIETVEQVETPREAKSLMDDLGKALDQLDAR